ncbi:VOC family protein [Flagellimonas sp. 2504JD4-2]
MNNFVWTDLSTFDLEVSKIFYSEVFGWNYQQIDTDYHYAYKANKETSGLYLMPKTFVDMGMPSFWMPYIQVDSVSEAVSKAKTLDGRVELTESMGGFGSVALIRDPSGAGFTVYDGNQLNARTVDSEGTMVWNELFVSDIKLVLDFYSHLFDWTMEETEHKRLLVHNNVGENIAAIQQLDNEIKGKHEYWAVFFKVANIDSTISKVLELGGKLIYQDNHSALLTDAFGAMFQVVEN